MSDYIIRTSAGAQKIILDGQLNTVHTIAMIPDNYGFYGDKVAQTLLQMVENYASDVPPELNQNINFFGTTPLPVTPLIGQLWYDTTDDIMKVRNNIGEWVPITSSVASVINNLTPSITNSNTLGTETLRWGNVYSTHLNVKSPDTDGTPAAIFDGTVSLRNTNPLLDSSQQIGIIAPYVDPNTNVVSKADVGMPNAPFNHVYTESIRFGSGGNVGLKVIKVGTDYYLVPDPDNVKLHLGKTTNLFQSVAVGDTKTGVLSSNDTDTNIIKLASTIIPVENNNVNIGTDTIRPSTIFSDTVYTNYIGNTASADGYKRMIFDSHLYSNYGLFLKYKGTGDIKYASSYELALGVSGDYQVYSSNEIAVNSTYDGMPDLAIRSGVKFDEAQSGTNRVRHVDDKHAGGELAFRTGGLDAQYYANPRINLALYKGQIPTGGSIVGPWKNADAWVTSQIQLSHQTIDLSAYKHSETSWSGGSGEAGRNTVTIYHDHVGINKSGIKFVKNENYYAGNNYLHLINMDCEKNQWGSGSTFALRVGSHWYKQTDTTGWHGHVGTSANSFIPATGLEFNIENPQNPYTTWYLSPKQGTFTNGMNIGVQVNNYIQMTHGRISLYSNNLTGNNYTGPSVDPYGGNTVNVDYNKTTFSRQIKVDNDVAEPSVIVEHGTSPGDAAASVWFHGSSRQLNLYDSILWHIYPVGAIFETTENYVDSNALKAAMRWTDSTVVWEKFAAGRVLVAEGSNGVDTFTAGTSGGSSTVSLTEAQMPGHDHTSPSALVAGGASIGDTFITKLAASIGTSNTGIAGNGGVAGNGQPHENMPPYYVVYRWRRKT